MFRIIPEFYKLDYPRAMTGTTISFELLDLPEDPTPQMEWQAFQMYIYNNVDGINII